MAPSNLAASIRQRLLNLAKQSNEDFQLLLVRYANERLLYRLSQSPFKSSFVLKGATLFSIWGNTLHRATRDIDLLGSGNLTEARLREIFSTLAAAEYDDGLNFDSGSVVVRPIRENDAYGGLRVTFTGKLGTARVPMQIDVGIGDAHNAIEVELPSLLALPAPHLSAYQRETVIAEKLEAAVKLGATNSRMKDFYDLATLGKGYAFDGEDVRKALVDTFTRRCTAFPQESLAALLQELAEEPSTRSQWRAFQRKAAPRSAWTLPETFDFVAKFASEPLEAATSPKPFEKSWSPGGPWVEKDDS